MLEKVYRHPKRVYLSFSILLVLGMFCYRSTPVALFPESSRPSIHVGIPYGRYTQDAFLAQHGKTFEYQLKSIDSKGCKIQRVEATYAAKEAHFRAEFSWNDSGRECEREVEQKVLEAKASLPKDIADYTWSWLEAHNTGYLFLQFHSQTKGAAELYRTMDQLLVPKLGQIREAQNPWLSNPLASEMTVEVDPLRLANHGIGPLDLKNTVQAALKTFGGGEVRFGKSSHSLAFDAEAIKPEDLYNIKVPLADSRSIYLSELAIIRTKSSTRNGVMKLNGEQAVSLFVRPAPGENIRAMCNKVFAAIDETLRENKLDEQVKLAVVVNPAEYIDAATNNVMNEVWLSSFIAVLVLFLFIGSFFGTFTTLLEIPTSIILSFILMRIFDVKINLISLGGLALSVGMNVDASIVIIDSIMKRIGNKKLPPEAMLVQVTAAVSDVWVPLFISTLTSLVVFIPLAFTSALTAAILGDLAKAVIFSHGLSLGIAMFLVPTVRLHLAPYFARDEEKHPSRWLVFLDQFYEFYTKVVMGFVVRPLLCRAVYFALAAFFVAAIYFIPRGLKREIVGQPETDLVGVHLSDPKSSQLATMEEYAALVERRIKENVGDEIDFVFTEIHQANSAFLSLKLKNKRHFKDVMARVENLSETGDPFTSSTSPFNPSELPIPNPPDFEVHIKVSDRKGGDVVADHLLAEIEESGLVKNADVSRSGLSPLDYKLKFTPNVDLYTNKNNQGQLPSLSDLSQLVAVSGQELEIEKIDVEGKLRPVYLTYPENYVRDLSGLAGFPVRVKDKVIPLAALGTFSKVYESEERKHLNGDNIIRFSAHFTTEEKIDEKERTDKLRLLVEGFRDRVGDIAQGVAVVWVNAKQELDQALKELGLAVGISLLLIFFLLYLQFDSVFHSLVIMLAIPFGVLGVLLSLYIFSSTLSLNSALGLILLNGIACANSTMLVEKILLLNHEGVNALEAVANTVRLRIRPILMTSLVTILGMFPIALGWGEGGKVLQPLGIAVCGGLWVSLICTLFVIPALEYAYLIRKEKRVA